MKFAASRLPVRSRMSHPARGAWIEIVKRIERFVCSLSHPARGAWIEIDPAGRRRLIDDVAPRKGCVD